MGEVYGWGRYVRGEDGWRSQFSYPKAFHLRKDQSHRVDMLKQYKVPIYLDTPLNVYDPQEEGYESRDHQASRSVGTHQEPDADEDED